MATTVLLLLLLLPLPLLSAAASEAHILLTTIKPALSGTFPNLELSSWNLSLPLCQWRGLTWTSTATFPTPIPCSSPPFRSNLSLISDHSLALLSLHLPAANLSGHLPPELSLLPSLRSLLLPLNSLSGPLPLDLFNSPSLQQLDLSSNRLSGALPVSFWNVCPTIITIRVNSNSISGPIPSPALPDSPCPNLTLLDLSSNQLTGSIPSLLFATALSDLDISDNSLSGQVPDSLIKLKNLTTLDVSHNNLTGQTPAGSARFGAEAFSANALCGAPVAPCAGAGAGGTGPSPGVIAGIVIGLMAGAVVAASLSIGWVQGRRRRRLREDGMEVDEEGESEEGKLVVFQGGEHLNLEDVLNATGEVMDKTSYGTVYKAKLADGGTIALRLLREGSCLEAAECMPVVRRIGRARHENLVALRAFYHGKRGEQLLIYDYLPNRSLHDLLHETGAGRPMLNWSRRHKIALGIARGLAYLHTGQEEPITHGNVRSKNVLVDEFFVARLTECGLDKLVVPAVAEEMVSAAKSDGYKAPELQKMKRNSARTDVFAFGILLLEILMGRRPGRGEGGDLAAAVNVAVLEETTMEVFDPEVMRGVRSAAEEGLVQALRLAMGCCSPVATVRPEMREVVRQLEENRPRNRSALYSPAESRSGIGTPL